MGKHLQHVYKQSTQQGFTLVELAIVLVIIGLIISSVLVGQDLIRSAELRATTKQYQEFQVAVNTFINKFGQIPGDIDGSDFGLGGGSTGAAGLGDQNGVITSLNSATVVATHNGEIAGFWAHLTSPITGYVPGTFDGHEGAAGATVNDIIGENLPSMRLGNRGWGVFGASGINYFVTGVIGAQADDGYDIADVFVPVDAFNIDDKIDDGIPDSGNIQSRGAATSNPDAAASTAVTADATVCNNTVATPTAYQFTATDQECSLRFRMVTF
jgi:prepilin-type N-terminal cleavage/methylation domain-containing protein